MRKYSFFLIAAISVFTFPSFTEPSSTVTFIPPIGPTIEKAFIEYKQDGTKIVVSGTKQGNKFLFECKVMNLTKSELLYTVKDEGGRGMQLKKVEFVLEPASLTIDMNNELARFGGSPFQHALNDFYNLSLQAWKNYFGSKESIEMEEPGMRARYDSFLVEKNALWEAYYAANKNAVVTAFTLDKYVTPNWKNLDKAEAYFMNLPATVKELPDVREFGEKLQAISATAIGKKCPDFNLPDSAGVLTNLEQFKGQFVLLDFWAQWCKPCRQENPFLVTLYKQYKDRGLEILAISFDEERFRDKWKNAIVADGLNWPNLIDTLGMGKSPLAKKLNINYIPKNVLLDRTGTIIAKNLHGKELEQKLSEVFSK